MNFLDFLIKNGNEFHNPITLVERDSPDQPLIYVNDKFRQLTGYEDKDIIGRNCRFLQGEATDKEATARIRESIRRQSPVCQDLLNYTKEGVSFINRLFLLPLVLDKKVYYIGLQNKISKYQFQKNHTVTEEDLLDKGLNLLTLAFTSTMTRELSTNLDERVYMKQMEDTFSNIKSLVDDI